MSREASDGDGRASEPPGPAAPRLVPERDLPAYRYVPGQAPHPIRDPAGHSFQPGPEPPVPACPAAESWRVCSDYLYGIDLFNNGYFWEAHEAWEQCWRGSRDGCQRDFLQGLIQTSAAFVQRRRGARSGSLRLAQRALVKLRRAAERLAADASYMGIDLHAFIEAVERCFNNAGPFPELTVAPAGADAQLKPGDGAGA